MGKNTPSSGWRHQGFLIHLAHRHFQQMKKMLLFLPWPSPNVNDIFWVLQEAGRTCLACENVLSEVWGQEQGLEGWRPLLSGQGHAWNAAQCQMGSQGSPEAGDVATAKLRLSVGRGCLCLYRWITLSPSRHCAACSLLSTEMTAFVTEHSDASLHADTQTPSSRWPQFRPVP